MRAFPSSLSSPKGANDLFVVRVAGNGLGDDVMGSLNYAVDHLKDSLRTIVILGHSQCGAVSAAVDVHLEPAKYMGIMTQKDLRVIVDRTLVVIQLGATWLERVHGTEVVRRPGYRTALIEVAIALNAALTANGVRSGLGLATRDGIDVVYGVYLLEERRVWSPRSEELDWFRLAPAPRDPNEFVILCDLLVSCPRVRALLDGVVVAAFGKRTCERRSVLSTRTIPRAPADREHGQSLSLPEERRTSRHAVEQFKLRVRQGDDVRQGLSEMPRSWRAGAVRSGNFSAP